MPTDDDLIGQGTYQKKTIFHGGFQYIERLDHIFCLINDACIPRTDSQEITLDDIPISQHTKRNHLLQILFRELWPKIPTTERTTHTTKSNTLKQEFKKTKTDLKNNNTTIQTSFIRTANEWEQDLRDVANKAGLLMPDKIDESNAFSQ